VQKIGRVMEEEVGERLPEAEPRKHTGRHKAKPEKHFLVSERPGKYPDKNLQEKDCEGRDNEPLNTRGDVKVEAHPIVLDAGP